MKREENLTLKKDVRSRKAPRASPEKKVENSLPKIEPLRGAVCKQMKRCGKPNCKCAKGQLHGPYYYRFFYRGGRQRKKYVKKGDFQAVLSAVRAYKQRQIEWRNTVRETNELAREIMRHNRAMGRMLKLFVRLHT